MLQVDLKGLPIFVMNLVLRRHPLAVYYVRRQMIDPNQPSTADSGRHRSTSSVERSLSLTSDEEFDDTYIFQSMELPEDFVPSGYDSDASDNVYSCSYEQSMPIEHFTKLY